MTIKDIPLRLKELPGEPSDRQAIESALALRGEAVALFAEEKYDEALERVVEALRKLREFSDYSHREFRALLAVLLFDLSETHFALKDYKQSEKELELLFKVLEQLIKDDSERFGEFHVLAMELSTRILRSRKKTLELLAKQQINTGVLYEKVNAGVAAATDKLVESLRKGAEMMAQTGDYRGAVRFYMEAIKLAKKRTGRVTRREVKMTVEMARVMMHSRNETARAKRLLMAVLPHAVSLENLELEQEILGMIEKIDADVAHEPMWRTFLEKVQRTAKTKLRRSKKEKEEEKSEENVNDTEH
ncbi:hypothetical protein [uncultured Duncaniella sp.]|jgi:tetratricopeptide (TPR) repeat protein|uniref:hypothetical protein n=1 Tax=uncultured Duncaniella sp. TaxID=2768039 RepID=UPI0026F2AE7F|nr:hypothetical protein [uncultured Duncaniella sp.]